MPPADRLIAQLAARQHGVVDLRDLRRLGLSDAGVKRRTADLRLRRLHRGVYSVGQINQRGRWLAAVRAMGSDAALSHRDGAALLGLRARDGRTVDVTVARHARRRSGINVHQTRALHPDDVTEVDGIPVTSVARTLLDLADVLPAFDVRRAYEAAERERALDLAAIRQLLERSNGRRGVSVLRALLGYDASLAADSKSELESRFLDLVRESNLPLPQLNVLVEGFLVDAYWPAARLVVELQSYRYHSDRHAFERDHAKFARLKWARFEVLPLTWLQVTGRPAETAAALTAILDHRSRR